MKNEFVEINAANRESARKNGRDGFFQDLFEIDLRSLAIFRIALGFLILGDLANRVSMLEMFYSDEGILPREMAQSYLGNGFWSLYWIDGSVLFARILFALTAVSAISFAVGLNTRLMNIVCLILVSSLQVCNPLVLTGGHIVLRLMLFWSMFLPLGAIWSVEARLNPADRPRDFRVTSIATMAIMIQVACLYFFSGVAKINSDWLGGHAVESILRLEMFVKPPGETCRQFPGFLLFVNYATVAVEIIGPILMFIPRINKLTRGMMMAIFWLMHISIWMTMSIGIFSLMAMASWLIFVPYQFWEFWNRYETDSTPDIRRAQTLPQLFGNIVCGIAFAYVLALNVANIDHANSGWFPRSLRTLGNATLIIQEFRLFGHPPVESPVIEYRAQLNDGRQADIFKEMITKPAKENVSVYQYFPTQHWRRVHSNLLTNPDQKTPEIVQRIRQRLLDRIVNAWNHKHDPPQTVSLASLRCQRKSIVLDGNHGPPIVEVWASWP